MLAETLTPTGVRVVEVDDQELRVYQLALPVLKNPNLPHQLDLKFVLCKTRVRAVCNCGWVGKAYKPEVEGGLAVARQEYRMHL